MTNRESILRSIKYIEDNLKSDIDVSMMAMEVCCSLYHFIRLFKSITDTSPKKYLLKRRLSESIFQLRNSKDKISTIAYDFQFSSNEVYTRAFKKQFKVSPSDVRRGIIIDELLITRAIDEEYIFQSKKARKQLPEIIELDERIIVGSSYFITENLRKLNLTQHWKIFLKMIDSIENKKVPTHSYQIQYWSENQILEGMHFFLGVEVDSIKNVSPELVVKIIPRGKYLRFVHSGLSKNVGYTYRYIYDQYLPDTDFQLSKPFNFELYGDNYKSANKESSESYIFIPIK